MSSRQGRNKACKRRLSSYFDHEGPAAENDSVQVEHRTPGEENEIGDIDRLRTDEIPLSSTLFSNVAALDNLLENIAFDEIGSSSDDDDGNDDESFNDGLSLTEGLLLYMITFNVSRRSMEYLLSLLRRHSLDVPSSVHNLKKNGSKKSFTQVDIESGEFAYCGILDNLSFCIKNNFMKLMDTYNSIEVHINIDGLPLFKGSHLSLWPILCSFKKCDYPKPLPIAVFCGFGKPNLDIFLQKLVSELDHFMSNFVSVEEKLVKIVDVVFIADAPARSYLQCIRSHNARFGCGYCEIEGTYINNKMCYLYSTACDLSSMKRLGERYNRNCENNQTSLSPLTSIIDIRNNIPPEYMHSVCLGVVRKMCKYFFSHIKGARLPCRLSSQQKEEINERITITRKNIPSEFNRKIRTLNEFDHFKASEFRSIICTLDQ